MSHITRKYQVCSDLASKSEEINIKKGDNVNAGFVVEPKNSIELQREIFNILKDKKS